MTTPKGLHILIIEDEVSIAKNIAQYMEHKGHILDFAERGDQGLDLALNAYYDVVILDLNLPTMDGLNVCQAIREKAERHIPILMLTARDSIDDKVSGFHVGTDDYLTKPFSLKELEVRCIALSKRHLLQTTDKIELGPLTIDRKGKTASREGQSLSLSSMGFKILKILAEAHPQVVSRTQLTQQLWGDTPTESDALRSHIYQLRNVVDKPFATPLIKTVFGAGFALATDKDKDIDKR
ncbi:response regulator transcription factor [Alteromonas sp. D210916BOD_24]|uniref:response regulator transcription factor n=1 Tax=Alteromonas sp. D210916BOD_24 TaxID=3157618 RepID=UPI00399D03C6